MLDASLENGAKMRTRDGSGGGPPLARQPFVKFRDQKRKTPPSQSRAGVRDRGG